MSLSLCTKISPDLEEDILFKNEFHGARFAPSEFLVMKEGELIINVDYFGI